MDSAIACHALLWYHDPSIDEAKFIREVVQMYVDVFLI